VCVCILSESWSAVRNKNAKQYLVRALAGILIRHKISYVISAVTLSLSGDLQTCEDTGTTQLSRPRSLLEEGIVCRPGFVLSREIVERVAIVVISASKRFRYCLAGYEELSIRPSSLGALECLL
jgi:hypothetical protein